MLKYEYKNGFYQNRHKLLLALCILIFLVNSVIRIGLIRNPAGISIGDCWLHIFLGMSEYQQSSDSRFELPILWFLFHGYLFFLTFSYPVNDLKEMGLQTMLQVRNRTKWVVGKIFWTIGMVVFFYLLLLITLVAAGGVWNMAFTNEVSFQFKITGLEELRLIPYFLPLVSDIAIAIWQMMLSFLIKPIGAYAFSIGYLILSVYWKNKVLLGNYSMLLRHEKFAEDGVQTIEGLIISFLWIGVAVGISLFQMNQRDVMGKA